jgi:ribosomal protein L15E
MDPLTIVLGAASSVAAHLYLRRRTEEAVRRFDEARRALDEAAQGVIVAVEAVRARAEEAVRALEAASRAAQPAGTGTARRGPSPSAFAAALREAEAKHRNPSKP